MKRFLSAGDGYGPNSLTNKLISAGKRYIQTSLTYSYGWLDYPLWVPKVTGIPFLVAMICFTLGSNPVMGQEGIILKYGTYLPIEGARIIFAETGEYVDTDKEGVFLFAEEWGEGEILLSANGYEPLKIHYVPGFWTRTKTFVLYQDVSASVPIYLGDSLPHHFWQIPLDVLNLSGNKNNITLEEYASHSDVLVLYFWATSCLPCIDQLDTWDVNYNHLSHQASFLSIHVGNQKYIQSMLDRKDWQFPTVVGENFRLLSKYFFPKDMTLGLFVVIKDGKLFAIPEGGDFSVATVNGIIDGSIRKLDSSTSFIWEGGGI